MARNGMTLSGLVALWALGCAEIEDAIVMLGPRFRDKDNNYYYIEYGGDGDIEIRKRVDGSEPDSPAMTSIARPSRASGST